MSGFEIAGVVLGSFPLLCDSAKEIAGFLRKAKSWWQFETTFETFVSTLTTQEASYTLVLKRLLDPLDISDSEYNSLLRSPQCDLWHELHVQDGLRQRLSSEYRWFMWSLTDLNQAVLDLQELLPIGKLGRQLEIAKVDASRKITFKPEPVDQSSFGVSRQQTIDAFLQTTSMRYSRLYMGLRFALTLLSLATSAWIPPQLAKNDIFLVCSEAGGQTARPFGPFFAKSSRDLQPPSHTAQQRMWNAKSTLLLLGIVLLELSHGETLENQASWAESLDENGQPNEITMFCGAFLWVGRAQKSMKEYIGEDLGGGLYEAIRKCICFDFDREDDFGDSRFAELVYREVVVSLEKCCPQF
ncbi:hypothetical protein CGLO_01873 [Colletotrichum gloeosporioides Cg-14]|uniref:DUF7580 domain-containing protein n=1 Tax=Colletotrichum gloeosporioides (strain Cg-14) TaxID=1237896 RepID=T0MAP7_COLGC|nr:hypothetical protein CGLO_01873 [Colletotrichum gloeosporioides Cg-14]